MLELKDETYYSFIKQEVLDRLFGMGLLWNIACDIYNSDKLAQWMWFIPGEGK